jgi:hypothetical protein
VIGRPTRWIAVVALGITAAWPARAATVQPCSGAEVWSRVGANTWRAHALFRSQGVTSTGHGWIFSWQGGISRTDDAYHVTSYNTFAPGLFQPHVNPDGTNHIGPTHIGDVDEYGGVLYAPEEDGGESLGPLAVNEPEYQHPFVALYDARTLAYTGKRYELPTSVLGDGVPWVGINHDTREVYSMEWRDPNNRIVVFDLHMHFLRFINLQYPAELGAGFHLSRIQGAEVFGNALYAASDDARKTIYKIALDTGTVTKAFSLDPPFPSELEGIAVRPTADGALLHVLIVVHQVLPLAGEQPVAVQFQHFALRCA